MPSLSDPYTIAIDQGGHASRAIIFNAEGTAVAMGSCGIGTHHPRPDQVEHDPEEMVRSIEISITTALQKPGARHKNIIAAGLATQRSSIVCWDRTTGRALSPIISWQDRRAAQWLRQFNSSEKVIRDKTGLVLSAHYGVSKLHWCLEHLPEVRDAHDNGTLAWGPLASFLIFRLLEERPLLIDPANASRTLLWNYRSGDWDADLLQLFGLPQAALPRCVPTRHHYGHIKLDNQTIPLHIVTGDQSAALFAFGLPDTETVYINMGTGVFLQRPLPYAPDTDLNLLCSIAYRDETTVYVLEGTVNGAGSSLAWVEQELGMDADMAQERMPQWLETIKNPPLYLNGVSGLGSPFWIPHFKSRFVGEGSPEEKLVAVAESIVFLMQVNLAMMAKTHRHPRHIVATGGLSTLDGLCQRLADLSGMEVYRSPQTEATARGTAWLLHEPAPDWSDDTTSGMRFTPRSNPVLLQRYHGWLAAMSHAMNEDAVFLTRQDGPDKT